MDLAQVFQMLALNKKVGLLSIQSAKLWKVLYFDQRGVTVHHNVHRVLDRVVAGLVRLGRLTDEAVDEVRDHAARMGQPLTDSLLAGGYLDPVELADQYRIELEEEVYDLFFCRDARFEFHENAKHLDGRDGTIDERFFFNCDSVIMEAARRIDEWAYISERVPTTAEVLVATVDAIDPAAYGAEGPAVFELIDGRRNVARIVELTGMSNFQVCKVASQLLDAGAIAPVAAEDLMPLAAECMKEGRLADAISLYERAVGLGVGIPEVHTQAAAAYQAAEEYEHAIYHLECEAEHRANAGDTTRAAQALLQVKQLVPTDLQARERLLELTLGDKAARLPNFDPLAEGKELVDLLIEFGDIQRVRALLERLLLVAPGDPDLKKALVNVHVKAGDQKRVAELYESIAEDLVRQGKPLEAVAYLQKILLVDRSRADISERVRKLYEFDERVRRRGRALVALGVAFCVLLVLGVAFWFYNERAEAEFARIDVTELVAREDFAAAAAAYQDFARLHPFTTAVAKADGELQQIEAARQQFEARRDAERAERRRHLERLRQEYQGLWAQHRELFLAGRPEESLTALSKVRELVAEAGAAEDLTWALEQQLERTWTRLRDFLAEAERLAADCERLLATGEWQRARELALRLHDEFDSTRAAQRTGVPVLVRTRPAGAVLTQGGVPMTRTVAGGSEPLLTPAVVLCEAGREVSIVAELDGFEPKQIVVVPERSAAVDTVLAVVARRRIAFPAPVQTSVGVGEGWLAVGLRGGRIGMARLDDGSMRVHELGGLKAVDGLPFVQSGRVFFATNENSIDCLPMPTASAARPWSVAVPSGLATELMVGEGRVAVVDRDHVLRCWEQTSGTLVWSVSLDSAASGPPTIDRRRVHVGTTDGRVLMFDATDGRNAGILTSTESITTRVLSDRGVLYLGTGDGTVRAVDANEGRVLWAQSLGRAPQDGEMVLTAKVVVTIGADGHLLALDRATGAIVGRQPLDGVPQRGLRAQGNRVFVQLRRPRARNVPLHDVVQAWQVEPMVLSWEFADDGAAPGLPACDDFGVVVPSSAGEVVLFR